MTSAIIIVSLKCSVVVLKPILYLHILQPWQAAVVSLSAILCRKHPKHPCPDSICTRQNVRKPCLTHYWRKTGRIYLLFEFMLLFLKIKFLCYYVFVFKSRKKDVFNRGVLRVITYCSQSGCVVWLFLVDVSEIAYITKCHNIKICYLLHLRQIFKFPFYPYRCRTVSTSNLRWIINYY